MKKTGVVLIIVGALILVLAIAAYITLFTSSIRIAFLNVESGDVQVDQGDGWQQAVDGMKLRLDDRVKTGADAEAAIILHESVIIGLEPNTEVKIADLDKDNLKIEQDSGSTWNKFTGLSGVKEYEIQTPETVATVRGTEFGVDMEGIVVAEGEVDVSADGEQFTVKQGIVLKKQDGKFITRQLTEEERQLMVSRMQKTLTRMKSIRQYEIRKKPVIYDAVKKAAKLDDAGINSQLERIDSGELDERELVKKSPVSVKPLERAVEMTQKIKKQISAIQEIRDMQLNSREMIQRQEK